MSDEKGVLDKHTQTHQLTSFGSVFRPNWIRDGVMCSIVYNMRRSKRLEKVRNR